MSNSGPRFTDIEDKFVSHDWQHKKGFHSFENWHIKEQKKVISKLICGMIILAHLYKHNIVGKNTDQRGPVDWQQVKNGVAVICDGEWRIFAKTVKVHAKTMGGF